MTIIFFGILFLLGIVLASFGGVIIERTREEGSTLRSVFGGRSFCPGCQQTLTRRQLIPLVGWLLQKGKCKNCGSPIPAWYVRSEGVMGVVFVLTGWRITQGEVTTLAESALVWKLIFWLLLNWGLVCLIIADLFRSELNLIIRSALIGFSLIYQTYLGTNFLGQAVLGGMILAAVYGIIYASAAWRQTRKNGVFTEGFGLGDVFMAGLIGSLSGFVLLPTFEVISIIQTVLLYLVLSSGLGIVFRLARKALTGDGDDHLPFIPAMIAAFWLFVFFGDILFYRL